MEAEVSVRRPKPDDRTNKNHRTEKNLTIGTKTQKNNEARVS